MKTSLLALVALTATAYADEPRCVDDSDIVGYRHCTPYGEWGEALREPYVFVDIGPVYRVFGALDSGATRRSSMPTPTPPESTPGGSAWMYAERAGTGLPYGLYVAIDLELGNFGPSGGSDPESVLVGLGEVGLQHRLGPVLLGGELAGGAMARTYLDNSFRGDALFEARGRVDIWLSPWATIGGVYGASLIDKQAWMAGVMIGFHTHTYGHRGAGTE